MRATLGFDRMSSLLRVALVIPGATEVGAMESVGPVSIAISTSVCLQGVNENGENPMEHIPAHHAGLAFIDKTAD